VAGVLFPPTIQHRRPSREGWRLSLLSLTRPMGLSPAACPPP
jgi:hypothetical protein